MSSKDYVNAVTDEVISRLIENKDVLGFVRILERDEEPSVLADSPGLMPTLIVQPLSGKSDAAVMTMGTTGEMYHGFALSISGYYLFNELNTDIRTMRGNAYTCLDLFRGVNQQVSYAYVTGANLDPGYFIIVDKQVYKWVVTLRFTMIEPSL